MRTILTIVLGLFIAQTIAAQSDSLLIKIEDYGQILIKLPNLITAKQKNIGIDSAYRNFYREFKKIDKEKFKDKNLIIRYSHFWNNPAETIIKIEEKKKEADVVYFKNGKEQSLQSGEFKLIFENYPFHEISVQNLDDLDKINLVSLDSLYLQALSAIQNQDLGKRSPYKIFYNSKNNQIDKNTELIYQGTNIDQLFIYGTIGMSVIDSRISPEWGACIEFDLRNKGNIYQKFGINYNVMYMYDKNNTSNISSYGFLGLNYYFRYKNSWTHKLSIGYMVNKSGNDFNGNTWNAYYSRNIKDFGFKFGGIYTKNTEGKYITMPSVGFDFWF